MLCALTGVPVTVLSNGKLISYPNDGAYLVIVFSSEQLKARHRAGITTSLVLATAALQGIEAVTQLNVRTTWAALAESEAALKGAIQSHHPVELFVQQLTASQRVAAKAISYGCKLSDIATNTQAEWVQLVRAQSEQFS